MKDKHLFCYLCQQIEITERYDVIVNNTSGSSSRFGCEVSGESPTGELGLNCHLQKLDGRKQMCFRCS